MKYTYTSVDTKYVNDEESFICKADRQPARTNMSKKENNKNNKTQKLVYPKDMVHGEVIRVSLKNFFAFIYYKNSEYINRKYSIKYY